MVIKIQHQISGLNWGRTKCTNCHRSVRIEGNLCFRCDNQINGDRRPKRECSDCHELHRLSRSNPPLCQVCHRRRKHLQITAGPNNPIICKNCGCPEIKILEHHHINGGGFRDIVRGGVNNYRKSIMRGRKDLEILCMICNNLDRAQRKTGKKLPFTIIWGGV